MVAKACSCSLVQRIRLSGVGEGGMGVAVGGGVGVELGRGVAVGGSDVREGSREGEGSVAGMPEGALVEAKPGCQSWGSWQAERWTRMKVRSKKRPCEAQAFEKFFKYTKVLSR